jgi:hypothetical protein
MPHPDKNYFKDLNMYLPWDTIEVGGSFFIRGGELRHRKSIYMAASRRGFGVSTSMAVEADGEGMRVTRTR